MWKSLHAGLDAHAFEALHAHHHDARGRRRDGQGAVDRAGRREALDLGRADVPVCEALARGCDQRGGAAPGVVGASLHALRELLGGEELLLGLNQLGRVDVEERLAALDRLAHVVHVDLLDEARVLGRDRDHLLLVVLEVADGADLARDRAPRDRCGLDVHVLDDHRVDGDHRPVRSGLPPGGAHLVGVDRHVVHAHVVLARHRRGDRRVHGTAVEEDPALSGRRARGASGARRVAAQRHQLHAADRAVARAVLDHLRVHAAGPESGLIRRGRLVGRRFSSDVAAPKPVVDGRDAEGVGEEEGGQGEAGHEPEDAAEPACLLGVVFVHFWLPLVASESGAWAAAVPCPGSIGSPTAPSRRARVMA